MGDFKAREKDAADLDDYRDLAEDVAEFGDNEYAKKLYHKAIDEAGDAQEIISVGESIIIGSHKSNTTLL